MFSGMKLLRYLTDLSTLVFERSKTLFTVRTILQVIWIKTLFINYNIIKHYLLSPVSLPCCSFFVVIIIYSKHFLKEDHPTIGCYGNRPPLSPDKFLKKSPSFMTFAQRLKTLFRLKVAAGRIQYPPSPPPTGLDGVSSQIIVE